MVQSSYRFVIADDRAFILSESAPAAQRPTSLRGWPTKG